MKNEIMVVGRVDHKGNLILEAETAFRVSASLRERTDADGNLESVDISWSSGGGSTDEMIALMEFMAEVRDDIIALHFPELAIDKCTDRTNEAHVVVIGDRVRCWDHEPMEGRPDRYVEGYVTNVEDEIITVDVYEDVCFKKTPRTVITTPNMTFIDYVCRITVLEPNK